MSKVSFNNYAKRAQKQKNNIQIACRYKLQTKNERLIILDVIKKLKINSSDSDLDFGSSEGNIITQLSFFSLK